MSVRQRLRLHLWHPIRASLDTFHLLPIVAAVIIFKLLSTIGQLRELYLSYLEQLNIAHMALAFVGLAMLSGALHVAHYWLSAIRQHIIFANFVRPNIGIRFRQIRRATGWCLAFVPWAALAVGLWAAGDHVQDIEGKLAGALGADTPELAIRYLPRRIWLAFAGVLAVGYIVVFVLDRCRESSRLAWGFVIVTSLVVLTVALAPLLGVETVALYRGIGPLATLAVALLFVLLIFTLLAVLSQKSQFPAFTLILVSIAFGALFDIPFALIAAILGSICVILFVLALAARLGSVAAVAASLGALALVTSYREVKLNDSGAMNEARHASYGELQARFETWIDDRRRTDATPIVTPYPVFIIAVEGGGIFAATATSLFLAKLQDMQPRFARHVFAISGVSGGAVGASLFQAVARQERGSGAGSASQECANYMSQHRPAGDSALSKTLSKIVQDDHFSPIVGSIVLDFFWDPTARARAIERSFVDSTRSCSLLAAQRLDEPYISHWPEGSPDPALVLNTTWAETGYRVAFAPFELKDSSDGTLYSFTDENMPGGAVNLIGAAVVSARFPGILSPYTAVWPSGKKWHFVDGGYADSSGAATALDLYRAIKDVARKTNADVRVILLTSSNPQPNYAKIDGAAFREILAPISAILKVREGLGNQAVARVCEYFGDKCEGGDGNGPLQIVRLEEEVYGLPLGWKISNATFSVLRAMVARPELCGAVKEKGSIIESNSCVLRKVEKVLSSLR